MDSESTRAGRGGAGKVTRSPCAPAGRLIYGKGPIGSSTTGADARHRAVARAAPTIRLTCARAREAQSRQPRITRRGATRGRNRPPQGSVPDSPPGPMSTGVPVYSTVGRSAELRWRCRRSCTISGGGLRPWCTRYGASSRAHPLPAPLSAPRMPKGGLSRNPAIALGGIVPSLKVT